MSAHSPMMQRFLNMLPAVARGHIEWRPFKDEVVITKVLVTLLDEQQAQINAMATEILELKREVALIKGEVENEGAVV